jgi:hypothetical protein
MVSVYWLFRYSRHPEPTGIFENPVTLGGVVHQLTAE